MCLLALYLLTCSCILFCHVMFLNLACIFSSSIASIFVKFLEFLSECKKLPWALWRDANLLKCRLWVGELLSELSSLSKSDCPRGISIDSNCCWRFEILRILTGGKLMGYRVKRSTLRLSYNYVLSVTFIWLPLAMFRPSKTLMVCLN